jgi:nucleoside-diphosphate-sugar epimerase
VDDLCEIIVKNIFNLDFAGKVFNVGASTSFSILNLAACVAAVANKYGLSAHQSPVLEQDLTTVKNNMVSNLSEIIVIPESKDLMEIVERFITEKYGIAYEY